MRPLVASDALAPGFLQVGPEDRASSLSIDARDSYLAVIGTEEPTKGLLMGLVSRSALVQHPQRIFADLLSGAPPVLPDTPLEAVSELMRRHGESAIAVLDGGTFAGVVSDRSLQEALLDRERQLLRVAVQHAERLTQWSARLEGLHESAKQLLRLLGESLLERDTLQRAIEVLAELLGARYGALALLGPAGEMQAFVHCGLTAEQVARIGPPPTGKGLLGVVVREDEAMRMVNLESDPRSSGFPPNHPPMRSLLAVPISNRGEVFGRIYLSEKHSGEAFTADDERLARCLGDSLSATLVSVRAIERQRALEAQLQQSQKLDAIGRLAGGVAHDFNSMLTVISCSAEVLSNDRTLRSDTRALIQEIRTATEHAAELTKQLLSLARPVTPSPQQVDLNELVEENVRMLARVLGGVRITTELEPGLGAVRLDPSQLGQILLNLAMNARDAMSDSGLITVRTRTAARLEPPGSRALGSAGVQLEVADTGSGIRPEDLSRVFEPFFSTKEPGKGTGLGLAVVYGIVEQNGGTIAVQSEVGKGTRFVLTFPAAR